MRALTARAWRPGLAWLAGAFALALLGLGLYEGGAWAFVAALGAALLASVSLRRVRHAAPARDIAAPPDGTRADEPLASLPTRTLAAAVPDPLVVFDPNGLLVYANPAAAAAFGALPVGLALPLRFRAPEMQRLIEDAAGGRTALEDGETEYVERGPLERSFRVSAALVGEDLRVLVFRDLGEARRLDRMRADFVANASHELRTPLASIAGFVETLRGPARNDAAARERFLGIIQEQTARMARLIDDLLSLSRLETKPYLDLDRPVDLAAVVRDVVQALSPLAAETGVKVEVSLPAVPVEVGGSRDELFQVVANLIENACKYGASGGRVAVALAREGADEVRLSVTDWGPGIAEEHLPRITERFYRADVASSRAKGGTGLGLAIVKHIVTRHRARLSIRSRPGDGATFSVHFPAGQAA
ncbi:MAG TPA: ATP-binding protein [Mesorhizobium sp.]|jgi:two-component system phosphate regulon sensor histidine kinase PhoR|nr:ATP-binding protein [Mesorhizobium sp.]